MTIFWSLFSIVSLYFVSFRCKVKLRNDGLHTRLLMILCPLLRVLLLHCVVCLQLLLYIRCHTITTPTVTKKISVNNAEVDINSTTPYGKTREQLYQLYVHFKKVWDTCTTFLPETVPWGMETGMQCESNVHLVYN